MRDHVVDDGSSVSAIITAWNSDRFIEQAIHSVLEQSLQPLEIIVVDDGSEDDTRRKISAFKDRIRYVHQRHQGAAAARNTGLQHARGAIIGFLDADDLWPAGRLEVMVAGFAECPSAGILLGRTRWQRMDGGENARGQTAVITPLVVLGSALIRRWAFEAVGPFDPTLRTDDDFDWYVRARQRGISLQCLSEVTLIYRRHDANLTTPDDWSLRHLPRTIKRALDRRRAMPSVVGHDVRDA